MSLAELVAVTSVFGLGLSFALLGSVKIRLTQNLGIDDSQMGKLFSVFNFSNLIFVLVAGVFCDMLGFKPVAIIGFIMGAVAIFIFGRAKIYGAAMASCILLGIGAMFMNTVGNTMLGNPEIFYADAARSNNLGNVFFGIGAFITPILTVWLFKKTTYATTMIVLAIIVLIPLIFALGAEYPEAPAGFSLGQAATLIVQPQIILCALALMCYIALEVSMGGWITTYMTHIGADEAKASSVLSGFWIFIMIGRLLTALVIAGMFSLEASGPWFIMVLALIAAAVLFYMSMANSVAAGAISVFIIGLAFAPIFPTVIGIMFARTEQAFHGTGFSIIFAVGLIGAIFLPAWMGAISQGKSIKESMKIAAGAAVILLVIAVIMGFAIPLETVVEAAGA